MSLYPYIDKYPELVTGVIKMYQRMGSYPMDPSTVFKTKEDLLEYVNMRGSYAYGGQIVVVTNGELDTSNHSMCTPYIIRPDKTIQPLLSDLHFNTLDDVESYINNNPDTYISNEPFILKDENGEYGIYTITEQGEIKQIITSTVGGTTSLEWKDIKHKPTTLEGYGINDGVNKEIFQYQTENHNFEIDLLTNQIAHSIRFIAAESFEDESGIDMNIEDGEYVVGEYLDINNNIINKKDDTTKVFLSIPVIPYMNIDSLYTVLRYSGEGSVTIDVSNSINNGVAWSDWTELHNHTEINYLISETNVMLRFRITLYGKVVLFGYGVGVI